MTVNPASSPSENSAPAASSTGGSLAETSADAPERLASVVFVCTGNICRSVTAERVLQSYLQDIGAEAVVDSAGISSEEEGNPIDPRQARVLAAAGYRTDGHAARRITPEWLADRDLAVAMTARHHRALERLIAALPAEVRPELVMLREFDPEAGWDPAAGRDPGATSAPSRNPAATSAPSSSTEAPTGRQVTLAPDVVDPWYGGLTDFEETLATMERSVPGITDRLRALARRSH